MNIPMLRDADDDAGFYAIATSTDTKWKGATLYQSGDGGDSYTAVMSLTTKATMGVTLDILGDFGGGNILDELNHITVSLYYGELSSVTYSQFINGAQAAIIGDEIILFRDATLNDDGTYTLTGLLRGRRGTEWAMSTHEAGERFILLGQSTMKRVPQETADIGMTRLYKAVTVGQLVADAESYSFTNEGAGLKPYAPAHLGGGRDASNNLTINWVRRTRISGEWRNSVDVPLGEASEAYEVEIWNSGYSTLLRTITGLSSPTASYSAAQQTSDGLTPGAPVHVRVYQLSGTVGRGYPADATI